MLRDWLITLCFFFMAIGCIHAQTKSIPSTELQIGSGVFFEATMDNSTSEITMTISGPDDRWFAVGFGLAMSNADILAFTDGKVGAMHSLGVWDYTLNGQNANGVTIDTQQDWSIVSNTTSGGTRTIIATRALNSTDPVDHDLAFSNTSIDLIWAKGNSSDNTFAYHGGNRGIATLNWVEQDLTAPAIVGAFTPTDDELNVSLGTNLIINFDEAVVFGTGTIELRETIGGAIFEQFDVSFNSNISVSASTVTINPTSLLNPLTSYYVNISSGAIEDLFGNPFTGFTDNSTWNFTTLDNSGDVTPPSLINGPFIPADESINVALGTHLEITFDEDITPGIGSINVFRLSDDAIIEGVDVNSENATFAGPVLTIDLVTELAPTTEFYVTIDGGSIEDLSGNIYGGFTDNSTWNFTTEDDAGTDEFINYFYIQTVGKFLNVENKSGHTYGLEVITLNGQSVYTLEKTIEDVLVDMSKVPTGIVFVKITTSEREFIRKLVLQ